MEQDNIFNEVKKPCNIHWPSIEDYIRALSNPLESFQRLKRFKPYIHPDGTLDFWNDKKRIVFRMIDSLQTNYEFGLECCLTEEYWKNFIMSYDKTKNDIRIYQDEIRIESTKGIIHAYPIILHRNYHVVESAEPNYFKEFEKTDNRLILSKDKKTVLLWNSPNGLIGKSLTSVVIPEGVENIADGAFVGCQNINDISFPSTIKKIGNWAFADCETLSIWSKTTHLEELGEYAFSGCLLKYVPNANGLPWNINKINKKSFKNTIVEIDRKHYIIRMNYEKSAQSTELINYPPVEESEEENLSDYGELLSNIVEDSEGVVYDSTFKYVIRCSNKNLENYKIKDSAIGICKEAFRDCVKLKEIDLNLVKFIAENAFACCESLKDIRISKALQVIGPGAFASTGITKISLPETLTKIGEDAFINCKELVEVFVQGNVEELPARVFFNCKQLAHVSLNENLIILGRKAFGRCKSLKNIILPPNLRKIGEFCFQDSALMEIDLPSKLVAMDYSPFLGCTNIKISSESPFFFANEQFLLGYNKTRLISYLLDEINIVIPGTVKVVLGYSLSNKRYAKRIYLPDSVEYIGHWAFRDTHAECVNFPKSISFIKSSFDYCASISKYLISNIKLLEGKNVSQAEIIKYQ